MSWTPYSRSWQEPARAGIPEVAWWGPERGAYDTNCGHEEARMMQRVFHHESSSLRCWPWRPEPNGCQGANQPYKRQQRNGIRPQKLALILMKFLLRLRHDARTVPLWKFRRTTRPKPCTQLYLVRWYYWRAASSIEKAGKVHVSTNWTESEGTRLQAFRRGETFLLPILDWCTGTES